MNGGCSVGVRGTHVERCGTMEQLRSLLLDIERREQRPTLVSITHLASRAALVIGLGRGDSLLIYQSSSDPPYLSSRGSETSHGTVVYYYDDQWTEITNDRLIDREAAFRAVAVFFSTGTRDSRVTWGSD